MVQANRSGQVPTDRDEVHLRDVPVRVLSEVLRDVDLFVGVASIGSDPAWQDNGGVRLELRTPSVSSVRLRRYRIHLGSGNVLMAPNDRYLCIVTTRSKIVAT